MKRIIKPIVQLKNEVDKLTTETRQIKKDLNKKLNFIYARLSDMGIDRVNDVLDEEEGSEEYPYGDTTEPYDVERDKELTE